MSKHAAKALLLATVAFSGSAVCNPALAGILDPAPAYPVRSPYNPPVYDWTGFYAGVSAGGTFADANWNAGPGIGNGSVSRGSGLIGGTMGYNSQNFGGPLVLSEEFDFSYRPYNFSIPAPLACSPTCSLTSDWVSTARLRFGYATGLWLPYITGGLTVSNFNVAAGQQFGTNNNVTFSWTVGAGVEFLITGPWSVKAEYLYMNHSGFACNVCDSQGTGPISLNISENVFRVGFNYRFGGW